MNDKHRKKNDEVIIYVQLTTLLIAREPNRKWTAYCIKKDTLL